MTHSVFGNYGVCNTGDDAMLLGLRCMFPGLIVFCGEPDRVRSGFQVPAHVFFPAGFRSWWKYLICRDYRDQVSASWRALMAADRVIIGGGGILVDRHLRAVVLWATQLWMIRWSGKPFVFLGNSFELQRWWTRAIFSRFLKAAAQITVRDRASRDLAMSLGARAELVEDLSLQAPELQQWLSQPRMVVPKSLCLALCQWGIGEAEIEVLKNFLGQRKREGWTIRAVAMQTVGDDDRALYRRLDAGLEPVCGLTAVLDALGSAQLVLGMRYHAVLMAVKRGVPVIAISYQSKVEQLMADTNLKEYWVDVGHLNQQNVQELFEKGVASSVAKADSLGAP